jgi:hypothetical protein
MNVHLPLIGARYANEKGCGSARDPNNSYRAGGSVKAALLGATMTELERVEREIATLQESVWSSTHALRDPNLSAEGANRERASIELYMRHLDELLTKLDDLQSLADD